MSEIPCVLPKNKVLDTPKPINFAPEIQPYVRGHDHNVHDHKDIQA